MNSAVTYQRKGGLTCFEQGSYNFSCEKRRTEEAKPKGPPVSNQRNHFLKELLILKSVIVGFLISFNPLQPSVAFLYPLRFSDVFKRYRKTARNVMG